MRYHAVPEALKQTPDLEEHPSSTPSSSGNLQRPSHRRCAGLMDNWWTTGSSLGLVDTQEIVSRAAFVACALVVFRQEGAQWTEALRLVVL